MDLYNSTFTNKQVMGMDQDSGLSVYTVIPKLHMYGLNAELGYQFNLHWSLYGSYVYTCALLQSNMAAPDGENFHTRGKTLLNTPRNLLHTHLDYRRVDYWRGPFWAALSASYHGAFLGDWSNTEQVGGYTTFAFNAGWHFPDWAGWLRQPFIKLSLANRFDRKALLLPRIPGLS